MIDEKKLIEELKFQINNCETYGHSDIYIDLEMAKKWVETIEKKKVGEWIPVEERLPEEHDSVFAELKGTDKWYSGMFEKMSDEVIVTCEYGDGTRVTKTSKMIDGKWRIETESIVKLKVLFWQSFPEPFCE